MAKIVGAKPIEVVIMNTLTTNLHLLMVSFYQPTKTKYKIVIESDAFPSDRYAVQTQLEFHGFDANDDKGSQVVLTNQAVEESKPSTTQEGQPEAKDTIVQ